MLPITEIFDVTTHLCILALLVITIKITRDTRDTIDEIHAALNVHINEDCAALHIYTEDGADDDTSEMRTPTVQ